MRITKVRAGALESCPDRFANRMVEIEAEVEPGEDPLLVFSKIAQESVRLARIAAGLVQREEDPEDDEPLTNEEIDREIGKVMESAPGLSSRACRALAEIRRRHRLVARVTDPDFFSDDDIPF